MIVASSVPVRVSEEAAQFIEEMGLQEPFQRMVDHIPRHFHGVQSINVVLEIFQDQTCDPRVILEVTREDPGLEKDLSDSEFDRWVIENFLTEQWQYFIHLSYCDAEHLLT